MESFCSEIDAQKEMISTPVVWVCRSIISIIMKSIKTCRTVPGEASLWRLRSCQLLQFFTGLLTNTQQFRSQQERQVKSHKYKQMNQSNRSLHTRRKREKKKDNYSHCGFEKSYGRQGHWPGADLWTTRILCSSWCFPFAPVRTLKVLQVHSTWHKQ